MPQYAKLSDAECSAIHIARAYAPTDARKTMKREIFSRAKVAFGIPPQHKMLCDVDVNEPNHGVLKNKATREAYELNDNGKWVGGANGTNVAPMPKRWFKVDTDDVLDSLIDKLDQQDRDDIKWTDVEPAGHKFEAEYGGDNARVVIAADGTAWVQLDKDAYEVEPEQEEEDDLPY